MQPRVTARVRYNLQDTGVVFSLISDFSPRVEMLPTQPPEVEASFEASRQELERISDSLRTATRGRLAVCVDPP